MVDHTTTVEYLNNAIVCATQPLVGWATQVNGHGTRTRDICQARDPIHSLISDTEATSGGICDAASFKWIMSKWRHTHDDPTPDLETGANPGDMAKTVAALKQIQSASGDAYKRLVTELARSPNRRINLVSSNDITTGVLADHEHFGTKYSVLIEFNFRLGFDGGHSTAVYRDGDEIEYFDINYGLYRLKAGQFADWFWWFMQASGYSVAFGSVDISFYRKL